MNRRWLLWIAYVVILVAALIFLIEGWQNAHRATVLVEWTTASELNTVGFNLFRATSPQGPLTQVNASLIPASSDPLTGSSYTYEDHTAAPGQTYYYTLEDVDNQGHTSRFGPIKVDSGRSGLIELAAALVLAATGLTGIFLLVRVRPPKPSGSASLPVNANPAWDVSSSMETPADSDETWVGHQPQNFSISVSMETPPASDPPADKPAAAAGEDAGHA